MIQPGMMRCSEAEMCSTSVPFSHSSTRARTMAAGLGMNSAGSRPALDAACQAAISRTNTSHGNRRRGTD